MKSGEWEMAFLAGESERVPVIAFTAPCLGFETT